MIERISPERESNLFSFFLEFFSSFFRRSKKEGKFSTFHVGRRYFFFFFLLSTVGKTIPSENFSTRGFSRGRPRGTLSDTRHNSQFGNCRCSGHAKPQFNYYTRVNWLAGSTVTRNAVQIDLGSPLSIDQCLPGFVQTGARLDRNPIFEKTEDPFRWKFGEERSRSGFTNNWRTPLLEASRKRAWGKSMVKNKIRIIRNGRECKI